MKRLIAGIFLLGIGIFASGVGVIAHELSWPVVIGLVLCLWGSLIIMAGVPLVFVKYFGKIILELLNAATSALDRTLQEAQERERADQATDVTTDVTSDGNVVVRVPDNSHVSGLASPYAQDIPISES